MSAPIVPLGPQKVGYCIPFWLRDEQILHNCRTVKGRLERTYEERPEPIAIVCYGPSLRETWEKVRDFKYIMTTSGAHPFLIDRGIIPTYHTEVDPRKHKIQLVGTPHKDVEYLIASTCHPDYMKHLEGFNLKLWHVFDPGEDGQRILPQGEWALTGGCGAGLRAMTLAAFLGFRDLHVFGMDGSEGEAGKHAGAHPNEAKDHVLVEYPEKSGRMWKTTRGFLEAARQTWHELDQMPKVKATFYGEGLVQEMSKHYKRGKPLTDGYIAFSKPELITTEFRDLNAQLHRDNLAYGVGGGKHAKVVMSLCENIKSQSVLDYGCGKGYLAKSLPFPIWEYDPAIPEKAAEPRSADLVVCTDVLEHIEPECLFYVLDHIRSLAKKLVFLTIHTGPAQKKYADGRNTHLTQQGEAWWREQLTKHFTIGRIWVQGPELIVLASPAKAAKPVLEKV